MGRKGGQGLALEVDDPSMSRHHARVEYREGRHWLVDLGSTNGSMINGAKLVPGVARILHPYDLIELGEHRFTYSSERTIDPSRFSRRIEARINDELKSVHGIEAMKAILASKFRGRPPSEVGLIAWLNQEVALKEHRVAEAEPVGPFLGERALLFAERLRKYYGQATMEAYCLNRGIDPKSLR